MRRALVLTDEAARHPFRATLPPHVCKQLVDAGPANDNASIWRMTASDARGVATVYFATLAATLAFIL